MSIKCASIVEYMEELAPVKLAESWDNSGLLLGSMDAGIGRILLALDVTAATINEAIELGCELIVTHHPFIFKGLKSIISEDAKGSLTMRLIRHNINVYCAHTNLDITDGGVNDMLAERLELSSVANFKDFGLPVLNGYQPGLGKTGMLKEEMTLSEFADRIKSALNVDKVRLVGDKSSVIKKAAVFCGSFDDDLAAFKRSEADVLVTGDLKYHTALDILQMGKCAVDAGHFSTERVIVPVLAEKLKKRFPGVNVFTSIKETDPFSTY